MRTDEPSKGRIAKSARDEFSSTTKSMLALRVAYRCSFRNCDKTTIGPSDSAITKTISIGEAAHITAAAPGGARYDPTLTPEQRTSISNGIWMCKIHARLIDVDPSVYPAHLLRAMKAEHEARINLEISGLNPGRNAFDFIAIGPSIVFVGDLVAAEQSKWSYRVEHFVIGNLSELLRYIDQFESADPYDKYVLVNELGDGRELLAAPSWSKTGNDCVITTLVKPSFPKIDVHQLPMTMALGDDHDFQILNGSLARIRGLEALPQQVKTCLSMSRAESYFAPSYGTRIREYSVGFFGSPWLPRLIKLEAIRMAAIPYVDSHGITPPTTPLRCVRKVISIEQIDTVGEGGWYRFRVDLDIEGLGEWSREMPILISENL
ncbi:hypothetical protein FBY06_102388 [Pseudomonas sp. SJZ085]|uniref:hypothetical protein n=1 Tax=unclassified Pseudomonas TaxID=196821 RepID=UPI00119C4472|nr:MULTISPECIES: hypothetical protein [unclassified Pseudomonas]TWC24307.1 hypothetical protein FBX99_103388 [Pseudomonas sp. SJZ074]TWC42046.1 hypothetical protein FBY06_102388 [Pseudomonas sp. SJZ085]